MYLYKSLGPFSLMYVYRLRSLWPYIYASEAKCITYVQSIIYRQTVMPKRQFSCSDMFYSERYMSHEGTHQVDVRFR